MTTTLQLGEISVDVVQKDIKNVHLSVYPPTGRVRISAPRRMNLETVRVFAISKLDWIKQQQRKLRSQVRETPREYLERESHYVWGRRYLLQVEEQDAPPQVLLKPRRLVLKVRPGADVAKRQAILSEWLRGEVRKAAEPLVTKWEQRLGVTHRKLFIQHMKTRWGSCNAKTAAIRLNTELAKKPRECLEYIVVHELVHLLERRHNARFIAILDKHLPHWRRSREILNSAPLAHESWQY